MERHAHDDVAQIKRRLRRAGVPLLPGKVVAELPFGFWRSCWSAVTQRLCGRCYDEASRTWKGRTGGCWRNW